MFHKCPTASLRTQFDLQTEITTLWNSLNTKIKPLKSHDQIFYCTELTDGPEETVWFYMWVLLLACLPLVGPTWTLINLSQGYPHRNNDSAYIKCLWFLSEHRGSRSHHLSAALHGSYSQLTALSMSCDKKEILTSLKSRENVCLLNPGSIEDGPKSPVLL